jgi:hypothetical protein
MMVACNGLGCRGPQSSFNNYASYAVRQSQCACAMMRARNDRQLDDPLL